jgi:hypothetical protein
MLTVRQAHETLRERYREFAQSDEGYRLGRVKYYFNKRVRGFVLHIRSGVISKLDRSEWTESMCQMWGDA